jgi:hypothetical protein
MIRRNAGRAAILLFVALLARSAAAQESAGIVGQVSDESGALLPGVTVTVTGPALQVPSMVGVTDERGEYRITPLPIGTYSVEYTLSGFQGIRREGVRLTVGFTARVDIVLKVGAISETITVSGLTPVVDVSATTATSHFTRETLEALPTSRVGITSILAQAPGVRGVRDVGGSAVGAVPSARLFGQTAEIYYTLEGVQTSSLLTWGSHANFWDYTAIDEAEVKTIGNGADVPFRGVNLNAIVKSGGDTFHGSVWWNKTSASLQSSNIDAKLAAAGITAGGRLTDRTSYTGDVGGRIIRQKLWFYVAGRRNTNYQEALNAYKPDGSIAIVDEWANSQTEKVSYQMSHADRLVGFYQYYIRYSPSASQFRPYEYRVGLTTPIHTGKIEWQRVYGHSLVTSLQYGRYYWRNFYWTFSPPGVPPAFDQVTLIETGPRRNSGEPTGNTGQEASPPRHHFRGATTWFKPDLFEGNHEFKFGFDYTDNTYGRQQPDLPPDLMYRGAYRANPYNYRLRFNNGAAYQLEVGNNPVLAKVVVHYLGLYGQDSWTIRRRLTLNLGVRYAHDNGFVPASCLAAKPPGDVAFPPTCYDKKQFNIWTPISPRLHASWDVDGQGKTLIKGGWGVFHHARQLDPELSAADPQVPTTVTYLWRDLNGNRDYDKGEVNLDPNGPDFVSQTAGSNTFPNPDEREPRSDEWNISLERELMADFAFRASGIYSRYHDVYRTANVLRPYESYSIPVTNLDPGPDGVLRTADDPGTFITYYEYPVAMRGRQFERFMLVNDPKMDQSYRSVDLSLTKRMSHRWQVLAAYSITRVNNPLQATTDALTATQNVIGGDVNPNAEINTSARFWDWAAKLSGVYVFPKDISVSAQLQVDSGTPYARQVLFRGGVTIPSITLNVEPVSSRRLPDVTQLDMRVEKSFTLRPGQKLGVRMNVFNALNTNAVLGVVRQSGPTFLRPTSIMPPRIAEFSMSYTF